MRGGEKVLEELCRLYPHADIFTLIYKPGSASPLIEERRIFESPLAKFPGGRGRFRTWLPFFPWAIESFDLKGYDLVISSSHCVSKGVIPPPDALHIAYVHTPMRYVWDMRPDYIRHHRRFKRSVGAWIAHYLRGWDFASSSRVDHFIANSAHVRRRIELYYRREATVIYPPVDTKSFQVGDRSGGYYIVVSALTPYKRVDLAIEACSRLRLKLMVVGEGPERRRLMDIAGNRVQFLGQLSVAELSELYRHAVAFIHAGEEDFGIAPVEAQAAGLPVIAFGRGGLLESVVADGENPTGMFFYDQTVESLVDALKNFDPSRFDAAAIRANAERFGRDRFVKELTAFTEGAWAKWCDGRKVRQR